MIDFIIKILSIASSVEFAEYNMIKNFLHNNYAPESRPDLLQKSALNCQRKKLVDELATSVQAKAKPLSIKTKLKYNF